ncbi:MAG: TonB-dependent receptor [Pseudomonadota bacterium]
MKRPSIFHSILLSTACLFAITAPAQAQETETAEEPQDTRTLETVQVRGRFIPQEVRTTSEVANLIDAADFALQGDSDAAAALSRVAGIATSEDNFIYVRGLNERYSTALLNGSPLPSPAPLRRVAPLDLFPTSALKSILLQKTFSPDLPGEFGGGMVDIRTKSIPSSRFFEASISGSVDTRTTLAPGLLYDGANSDAFGYDDGTRNVPSTADGLTAAFGRELTANSSLLVLQETEDVPGNFGFGLTGGDIFDLSDNISMGFIASANYSNDWVTKEGRRGNAFVPGGDDIDEFDDFERFSTENAVGVDGFASVGFNLFDRHEIAFNGLITRASEKEARTNIGINDIDEPRRVDALEWFERQLWTGQVTGEHVFPDFLNLELNWRGSYSEATRDAPYQTQTIYVLDDDLRNPRLLDQQDANQFTFSEILDDTTDFGIDLALPLERYSGDCNFLCEVELKAGYSYVENDREATSRVFGITGISAAPPETRLDFVYDFIFNNTDANGNILGGVRQVSDTVQPSKYIATLEVDAAYLGVDAQITPFLRAAIGGRYEDAIQAVVVGGFEDDLSQGPVDGFIEEEDFLPAATVTWNPIEDVQVRFGYSKTITRPQFRELSPAIFVNTETDVTFFGNPFLQNSELDNYDARFEYYYAADQFFTFGVFYKDMVNPIEEVIVPTENIQTTFLNAPEATLYGFEIEYESPLNVQNWFGWESFGQREIVLKTNYTWSDSDVKAEGEVAINAGTPLAPVRGLVDAAGRIEDGRRLQGQSEHLFNLQLIYTDQDAGFDANLLFNFASERIRTAETLARNIPAILEQPPATVDLVMTRRFEAYQGEYEVSFQIKNLLAEGYEAYQEQAGTRVLVDTYDQGAIVAFGLKRIF